MPDLQLLRRLPIVHQALRAGEGGQVNTKYLQGRFVVLYVVLGVILAASYGALWYGVTHPKPKVDPTIARKSDIKTAAGEQNLVYLCESSITQSINSNGGKVKGFSHPTQKTDGRKVKVSVTVGSDIYNGRLTCSFEKSNWQLGQIAPAA